VERAKVRKEFLKRGGAIIISAFFVLCGAMVAAARARESNAPPRRAASRLATITGTVRDAQGNPLAGAVISLLREGVERVVKEIQSGANGNFTARVAPGRYILRAVADGFSAVTSEVIQVHSTEQISYGFKLEPIGQGRTLPERRRDHDDTKLRLRAAHINRSIFQYDEKDAPNAQDATRAATDKETDALDAIELSEALPEFGKSGSRLRAAHGFIETYTASGGALAPGYFGTNFAVETPVNDQLDLIFAGQFGGAPVQRFQIGAYQRVGDHHRANLTFDSAQFKNANHSSSRENAANLTPTSNAPFGQIAVRAVDEWVVRDGVVLVLGLDYSRFVGGEHTGASFSPRLGVQFDTDARTRLRAAYAPHHANERAQSAAQFEDETVLFTEPEEQPIAFVDGRAVVERNQRLEFGIERVLDGSSSVEATAFFDTTNARGVGFLSLPLNGFAVDEETAALPQLAQANNQQGAARGVRVVYARRLNRYLKASGGYAFGRGQAIAPQAASLLSGNASVRPDQIFRNAAFQAIAAELDADLHTGTRVRTVLRFSPRAAVFAIDPFAGRLAVYDPSLSIIVAQDLPTFGLPVRATAIFDARNLFDLQPNTDDGDTIIALTQMRRSVRGGISVRF
jgi:hypothetical protein